MKKLYTFLLAAASLAASAGTPAQLTGVKALRKADVVERQTHLSLSAPAQKTEPEHQWIDLGEGTLVNDITTGFFYEGVQTITVDVQRDAANEGWYRVVNPWKNYVGIEYINSVGGTLTQTDDITIVIDASNPDYVRILRSNIGMDDGYGPTEIVGYTEMVGVNLGWGDDISQAMADAKAGKMADGTIIFDEKNDFMLFQDGVYYNANSEGKFSLTLPGGSGAPIDYTLKTNFDTKFCPSEDGKYYVTFSGDDRIPGVKYIGSSTYPETEAEIDYVVSNLKNNGQIVAINEKTGIDISSATGSEYFIFFCAVDADGNLADEIPYYAAMWVPDTDTDGWTSLGNATMTEGFISCLLPDNFSPETYQVEVQRNIAQPGLFRIVDPYAPWSAASNYLVSHDHSHYIYFNADNFDNVYIMESGLGLELANYGEVGIGSGYYDMVRQYGLDFLEMFGLVSGGTIKDGVLSFDGTNEIQIYFSTLGKWFYTNLKDNPDFVEGVSPDSERYLGGDFKLDMSNLDLAGISDLNTDEADAAAEYFNLQGIRVHNPEPGNVYICRKGSKATKILIR